MEHNKKIRIYDENTMFAFSDGYYFNIDEGESYDYDDKLDKSRVIPDDVLIKWDNIVKEFDSNLSLVYDEKCKYYFIAYLNTSWDDWEWTEEMEELSEELSKTLTENGIGFQ